MLGWLDTYEPQGKSVSLEILKHRKTTILYGLVLSALVINQLVRQQTHSYCGRVFF
jgi:hypothetical protein